MSAAASRLTIEPVKVFEKIKPASLLFDVLLAAVVLVLGLTGIYELDSDIAPSFTREPDTLHTVLIVLTAAPVALRRVYPAAVFFATLVPWMVERSLDYPESLVGIAVAIMFYTVGAELPRRTAFWIGGTTTAVLAVWTTIGALVLESVTAASLASTLISTLTPLLLGREMRARRRRVEELRERAVRAEQEREEKARRAVADERTRIARDLHDVVAHQMTVMTLQAEGAKRIAEGSDPRVIEALETISQAGHGALAEMRRMVGLLRSPEDESETEPLPTLAKLDHLVETVRATGMPVDLEVNGKVRTLSEAKELSAYRIVQESLTNAVRHGGPKVRATVTLDYGNDQLDVQVVDDGRGASARSDGEGGHGIVGMRERIAVLGGEFAAGPNTGGGFRVHATIPVES